MQDNKQQQESNDLSRVAEGTRKHQGVNMTLTIGEARTLERHLAGLRLRDVGHERDLVPLRRVSLALSEDLLMVDS